MQFKYDAWIGNIFFDTNNVHIHLKTYLKKQYFFLHLGNKTFYNYYAFCDFDISFSHMAISIFQCIVQP